MVHPFHFHSCRAGVALRSTKVGPVRSCLSFGIGGFSGAATFRQGRADLSLAPRRLRVLIRAAPRLRRWCTTPRGCVPSGSAPLPRGLAASLCGSAPLLGRAAALAVTSLFLRRGACGRHVRAARKRFLRSLFWAGRCGAACGPLFVWVGGLSAPRLIVWWNRYGELTVSLCVGGRAGHGRVPLPPSPPPLLLPVS